MMVELSSGKEDFTAAAISFYEAARRVLVAPKMPLRSPKKPRFDDQTLVPELPPLHAHRRKWKFGDVITRRPDEDLSQLNVSSVDTVYVVIASESRGDNANDIVTAVAPGGSLTLVWYNGPGSPAFELDHCGRNFLTYLKNLKKKKGRKNLELAIERTLEIPADSQEDQFNALFRRKTSPHFRSMQTALFDFIHECSVGLIPPLAGLIPRSSLD